MRADNKMRACAVKVREYENTFEIHSEILKRMLSLFLAASQQGKEGNVSPLFAVFLKLSDVCIPWRIDRTFYPHNTESIKKLQATEKKGVLPEIGFGTHTLNPSLITVR